MRMKQQSGHVGETAKNVVCVKNGIVIPKKARIVLHYPPKFTCLFLYAPPSISHLLYNKR